MSGILFAVTSALGREAHRKVVEKLWQKSATQNKKTAEFASCQSNPKNPLWSPHVNPLFDPTHSSSMKGEKLEGFRIVLCWITNAKAREDHWDFGWFSQVWPAVVKPLHTLAYPRRTIVETSSLSPFVSFVSLLNHSLSVLKRCVPKTLAFAFGLRLRCKMRCFKTRVLRKEVT